MAKSGVQSNTFIGAEVATSRIKMSAKMLFEIFVACAVVQLFLFYFIASALVPAQNFEMWWTLKLAKLAKAFFMNPHFYFKFLDGSMDASMMIHSPVVSSYASKATPYMFLSFLLSCAAYLLAPLAFGYFKYRAVQTTKIEHIRGMQLIPEADLAKQSRKQEGFLPFGSVRLPNAYLPEHAQIVGKTRVGKTVCMMQQLCAIRDKGYPAIVYDFKGEYVAKFYRPGIDHIFNPLDERGAPWDLFSDLSIVPDISAITGSLIPPPNGGDDKFWSQSADAVLSGCIAALWYKGPEFRNHDALFKVLSSPIDKIADLLLTCEEGAMGHSFIQDASSKQAQGVISTVNAYCCWLYWCRNSKGFSVQKWLENPGDSFIFLTGNPSLENTLRPYISLIVDLLGKRFLSLPDSKERKLFFCLDEFGNMQKLPTVTRLLTAGGSKGAVVILGYQDVAAVQDIYGPRTASTILNSCGTALVLKLSDEATAKHFSGVFGDCQYWEASLTQTMGPQDGKDGQSIVRQKTTEKLVLPSEIQGLMKREGYLLIPEHSPSKIRLEITDANNLPDVHEGFKPRVGISLAEAEVRAKKFYDAAVAAGNHALEINSNKDRTSEIESDELDQKPKARNQAIEQYQNGSIEL